MDALVIDSFVLSKTQRKLFRFLRPSEGIFRMTWLVDADEDGANPRLAFSYWNLTRLPSSFDASDSLFAYCWLWNWVTWAAEPGTTRAGQIGVQSVDPAKCIWDTAILPATIADKYSSPAREQRMHAAAVQTGCRISWCGSAYTRVHTSVPTLQIFFYINPRYYVGSKFCSLHLEQQHPCWLGA